MLFVPTILLNASAHAKVPFSLQTASMALAPLDGCSCHALRQVYDVTGTALAKTLSGSLELILKNKNNKTATALGSEATEWCLQSFVGVLCALCPCPSGDSRDTTSKSEAGRRLGDVCIVALPVLCPGLGRYQLVRRDQTVRSLGIERAETETTRTTTNKLRRFQDNPIPTEAVRNVDCMPQCICV